MARIFKSSSDKALKSGLVVALGAGAVLAGQAVQNDNVSVAHAKSKGGHHASASHSSGGSHHASASHSSGGSHSSASHSSSSHSRGTSSSHASDVRQMHNAYSDYHKKHNSYHRGGEHQVDTNRKGKVTSTTDRHTDANGNTVSTITNHNKARTLRNGKKKETWISQYGNGATSHNNNWDGKHPGQTGFTDANGKDYWYKNPKAGATVTDSAGNIWTYDKNAGHWQQTIVPHDSTPTDTTPSTTEIGGGDVGGGDYNWNPDPHPSGNPTPTPHNDPVPIPVQTKDPAPQKPAQSSTPAPAPEVKTGTQTFNFVDKATNQTVGTSKVSGDVGKDVAVSLKVPNGYKLVAGQTVPTSANIKDKDNPINILVEKDANPDRKDGTQTIRFIDKATSQPVSKSTVGGKVGDNIPVDPKVPDGYELVPGQKLPKNVDIKDTDTPIDILVQKKNPDRKDGTQTIRFIDKATGQPVSKSTVGGKVGDKVSVDPKVPDGYELVPGQTIPKSVDIKGTDTPIDIQVQKKDNNKKPATQTYEFVDKNGNKIVGTAKVNGNVGDKVPVSLKLPKGYKLVPGQKLPTLADLKATDNPIKIMVEKDGNGADKGPADSGLNGKNKNTPNKGNNGNGGNGAGNNVNGGNGIASLPKTGNSASTAGILGGGALLATMATLGIAYNKKKRNA